MQIVARSNVENNVRTPKKPTVGKLRNSEARAEQVYRVAV